MRTTVPQLSVVAVQLLSCVWLFETPQTTAWQASLSFTVSPGFFSDLCPLSSWCYLIISPSDAPYFFGFQSFPASESFPMSWLFTSGGQSIGASALGSVLPKNIQGWFPLGWVGMISLQSKGFSKSLLQHHDSKSISSSALSLLYGPALISVRD